MLTAQEAPSSSGYSFAGIDKNTCRRCSDTFVKVERFTDWCKMNGDAGGREYSMCQLCGLLLWKSWDDDD